MRRARRAARTLAGISLLASCGVLAAGSDPPVPAGRDPGGIPVALICGGIDYTPDAIAARLARDGEGEITAYDYIDDDRRPFGGSARAAQDMAEILLAEGQTASLILVRTDTSTMIPLSRALMYAGKSPARIIVLEHTPREREAILALGSAIRYFHDRLFVMAAGEEGRDLDQDWGSRLQGLPNLVIVTATDQSGSAIPGSNSGALTIDLATTGAPLKGWDSRHVGAPGPSLRSAAHVAALAVRLKAVEPAIPAAALKVRIAALAKPGTGPGAIRTINGVIERPERYFWLE